MKVIFNVLRVVESLRIGTCTRHVHYCSELIDARLVHPDYFI